MGLGGGGGGGILGVGNSFTGASLSLELIGDHAFGYSGAVAVADSDTDLLAFTTGNYYLVAKFQPVLMDAITDDYEFKISFAGVQILSTFTNSYKEGRENWIEIIIPSYTPITVEGRNRTGSGNNDVGAVLTGRVYR